MPGQQARQQQARQRLWVQRMMWVTVHAAGIGQTQLDVQERPEIGHPNCSAAAPFATGLGRTRMPVFPIRQVADVR